MRWLDSSAAARTCVGLVGAMDRYGALLRSRGDADGERRGSWRGLRDAVDALDVAVRQSPRIATGVVATEGGLECRLPSAQALRRGVVAPAQNCLGSAQIGARLEGLFDRKPEPLEVRAVDLRKAEIDRERHLQQLFRGVDGFAFGQWLPGDAHPVVDADGPWVQARLDARDRSHRG